MNMLGIVGSLIHHLTLREGQQPAAALAASNSCVNKWINCDEGGLQPPKSQSLESFPSIWSHRHWLTLLARQSRFHHLFLLGGSSAYPPTRPNKDLKHSIKWSCQRTRSRPSGNQTWVTQNSTGQTRSLSQRSLARRTPLTLLIISARCAPDSPVPSYFFPTWENDQYFKTKH